MTDNRRLVRRVEWNFAACEGFYWVSFCALAGFVTVYLSWRGFSDTQIGLTSSLSSLMAIGLQLVLSAWLDSHPRAQLRKLITVLSLIAIAFAALVAWVPMGAAAAAVAFAAAHALINSNNGYLNAQLVQFNNAGIPAAYGWPRGIGSIFYATAAYFFGDLSERYTPGILMPLFIAGTLATIAFVLLMPDPGRCAAADLPAVPAHRTSYREMLFTNPTLVVLLVCTVINSIGYYGAYTFTIRVVERAGGGTYEFGLSEFLRAGSELPAMIASGWLLRHFRPKALLTAAFACYGLRCAALALAPTMTWVYLASLMNMCCVGLNLASSVLMINSIVRPGEKVRGQSLNVLSSMIGSIIGTFLGGILISAMGLTPMLLLCAGCCMLASLGMGLLCRPPQEDAAAE